MSLSTSAMQKDTVQQHNKTASFLVNKTTITWQSVGKLRLPLAFRIFFKSTSVKLLILLITCISCCCILKLCSWKLIGSFSTMTFICYQISNIFTREKAFLLCGSLKVDFIHPDSATTLIPCCISYLLRPQWPG